MTPACGALPTSSRPTFIRRHNYVGDVSSIALDSDYDGEALLVFQDGRLAAVLTRLEAFHEDLAGRWYIEMLFSNPISPTPETFESPEGFAELLS